MGFAIFAIIIVAVVIVFLILGSVKNPLDNEMGKLQNWIDRKYRKAYYNNKRWDFPHKCLRRRC